MSVDTTLADLKPPYSLFFDAWHKARKTADVPWRTDISLRDFAPFADSMQIYELRGPGQLHCRLMGSEIVNRAKGFNPDDNIFDFFKPETRPVAETWWQTMADTPCGGVSLFSVEYPNGSKRMVKTIVLPVRGKAVKPQFIIYNDVPEFLHAGPERNQLVIAEDSYQGVCIDVGFGAPSF